jgi:PAS domain S-box-containing protein
LQTVKGRESLYLTPAKILLVDDQPANLLVLRAILEDFDYDLVEAHSGEEALQRLSIGEFALVLLDVQMPGLDGFETAKLIRKAENTRHTPIIFVTAFDDDRFSIEAAYSLGAVDYLVKPIIPVILRAKIQTFVELFQEKQRSKLEAERLLMAEENSRRLVQEEAARRAAEEHATSIQRAAEALRESEARKSAIVRTALDCVITMNHEGKVVEFNDAAETTFGFQRDDVLGKHLADLIIPLSFRKQYWQGLAHYLSTGEGPVLNKRLELFALRADGYEFPVELSVARIPIDGPPIFTAYLRDISERTKTEIHRNLRLVVTQILAEEGAINSAIKSVLKAICEALQWDMGLFWAVDKEIESLRCVEVWHIEGKDNSEFETLSQKYTFKQGEGLPGRVWASGRPAWIQDIVLDSNFPRATVAAKDNIHGAFGCPLVIGNQMLGVIEFFSQEIREPDDALLELMGTIAGQIAQFMERVQSQEQLRDSEEELIDFFENATIGLHWVGPDGTILRANRAELELLGYDKEEYIGRKISEFHVENDVICDILTRLQAGQKLTDYPSSLRCKDGSIKDVLIDSNVMWKDERFIHTRCFTRDVTELRRTEQSLRFLADASASLATLVDYQGTLELVAGLAVPKFADWCAVDIVENDGSLRRLAVVHVDPAKVQLAQEYNRCYPPDPGMLHGVPQVLRTGKPDMLTAIHDEMLVKGARDQGELRMLRELGFRSYMCVPLKGRDKLIGVISFVSAESERRYTKSDLSFAEELARRAGIAIENAQLYVELKERDRRKDEFLATLAHELRNPLAPIRNGLQLLNMRGVDSETSENLLKIMERQVDHLVRLVDDLLNASRVMRGKIELRKEPVQLATIIAHAVETANLLIQSQDHQLTIDTPPESLMLEADPVRLTQIIANLLANAAKYTEKGGHIWLTVKSQNGQGIISIRDNGIGVAPDMLPHIFELFVQADHATSRAQGGLGIGLTLVKNLVEMHGGKVEVHSSGLGKGSEFIVRLPLLTAKSPTADFNHALEQPVLSVSGHRLLVVDDNVDSAKTLAALLRLKGHDVQTAFDGISAIEMAKQHRPQMIFLDIGMPGMDGYEVARRVRNDSDLKSIVLAAVTGWGQQEDRRRSAEAGFDHHLVKPLISSDIEELLMNLETEKAK